VYRVEQQDNHFHDVYVPLQSTHKQFVQQVEMENNINLDEVDDVMFVYPDQVVY
jgi:argonaute-like protein implicated in RNA metabolism and viral defense